MKLRIVLAMLLLAGTATAALAENPVKVTSDKFVIDDAQHIATFTGNVVVVRATMTVWAAKVVVEYGQEGPSSIKSFTATGKVRIKTSDQDATGDKAVFNPTTQILRMTGNVNVTNSAGTLNGPELVIDLAKNTSVFTGGTGGRVTGVFTPK